MKLLVLVSLLVAAESSLLQSYSLPNQGGGTFNQGTVSFGGQTGISTSSFGGQTGISTSSFGGQTGISTSSFGGQTGISTSSFGHGTSGLSTSSNLGFTSPAITSCGAGQVLHAGSCVTPEVMRNVYVYTVPDQPQGTGPRPQVPLPKVEHNILFVRLPENVGGQNPIVVPPPQQNNIVYILKKKTSGGGPGVINVPAPAKKNPEVYFVNYGNGENPTLPGGIDLQTALASAVHQGQSQVIGSGSTTGVTLGTGGNFGNTGGSISGGNFVTSGGGGQGGIITSSSIGSTSGGGIVSGGTISTPTGLYTPP